MKTECRHVPYRDLPQTANDLIADQIRSAAVADA